MSKPQPGHTSNYDLYVEHKRTHVLCLWIMALLAAVAAIGTLAAGMPLFAGAVYVQSLLIMAIACSTQTRTPLTSLLDRFGENDVDTLSEVKRRRDEMRADGGGEP